jgi:hypothetical protein
MSTPPSRNSRKKKVGDVAEKRTVYAESLESFLGDMMLHWYGCTLAERSDIERKASSDDEVPLHGQLQRL